MINAPNDVRLPHADDLYPNFAMFMIVRALAEACRGTLDEPIPEPLARIVRRIETRAGRSRVKRIMARPSP